MTPAEAKTNPSTNPTSDSAVHNTGTHHAIRPATSRLTVHTSEITKHSAATVTGVAIPRVIRLSLQVLEAPQESEKKAMRARDS